MPEIPYEYLQGTTTVVIEYSGSGDEGYINDIRPDPDYEAMEFRSDLYNELERWAYDVLSERYPGWEINEGSEGTITIHVQERRAVLRHGDRVEHVEWHPEEEIT